MGELVPSFERFMSLVERAETGCWLWRGAQAGGGAGGFTTSAGQFLARRWIYAFQNDGLADCFALQRLCSTPNCVNPAHHRPTLKLRTIEDRLIAYSDRSGGPDACWPWTRAIDQGGYGKVHGGVHGRQAHRVAWILANGPIPDGLVVMHACDNRRCINLAHLSLGTHDENMVDMARKHRVVTRPGASHPAAKLTAEQVATIRTEYASGTASQAHLAARFGVSKTLIHNIVNGLAWKGQPS